MATAKNEVFVPASPRLPESFVLSEDDVAVDGNSCEALDLAARAEFARLDTMAKKHRGEATGNNAAQRLP